MTALAIQLKQELYHPKWKSSPELNWRILPWNSKKKKQKHWLLSGPEVFIFLILLICMEAYNDSKLLLKTEICLCIISNYRYKNKPF